MEGTRGPAPCGLILGLAGMQALQIHLHCTCKYNIHTTLLVPQLWLEATCITLRVILSMLASLKVEKFIAYCLYDIHGESG